jgi:SAM-dependent methyltransferase
MTPARRLVPRLATPYGCFADAYDESIGIPFFMGNCLAFERLVREYGIVFRSAADLGCGTGLFASYLGRRWGATVIGVDRSPAMLLRASRRCAGANIRLLCQDIRCLRLPCRVDLVTANFDTLNHLLSERQLCLALRGIADNLRPGGHFVFDFVTPCQQFRSSRRRLRSRLTRRGIEQSIHWHPASGMLSIAVIVDSARGEPPIMELHRERAYAPAQMTHCLLDAGFVIRGVHDAQTLRPATRCSPRLIVVAQKAGGSRARELT